MKTIIFSISIFFIFQSCKDEPDKTSKTLFFQFEAKNESIKDVVIYLYRPNTTLFKQININTLDSAILDEGKITPTAGASFSLTNSLDSAVIMFSDGKKLIQTFFERGNNDTINNILASLSYKSLTPNDNVKKERFTITQTDYNRAQ